MPRRGDFFERSPVRPRMAGWSHPPGPEGFDEDFDEEIAVSSVGACVSADRARLSDPRMGSLLSGAEDRVFLP